MTKKNDKTQTLRYSNFETFRASHFEGEQPCLIIYDTRKFGTIIPISTHSVVVGRNDDDVITIGDNSDGISHRHAEFTRDEDSVTVRDLKSNNGV